MTRQVWCVPLAAAVVEAHFWSQIPLLTKQKQIIKLYSEQNKKSITKSMCCEILAIGGGSKFKVGGGGGHGPPPLFLRLCSCYEQPANKFNLKPTLYYLSYLSVGGHEEQLLDHEKTDAVLHHNHDHQPANDLWAFTFQQVQASMYGTSDFKSTGHRFNTGK